MAADLLSGDKLELLQELGFEADEDEAEWLRWFMDLARCATAAWAAWLACMRVFFLGPRNGRTALGFERFPVACCAAGVQAQ